MLGVLGAIGYIVMNPGHISNYCSLIYISKLQGSYIFPYNLSLSINCPLSIFPRICLYNQNALNLSTSFFQMLWFHFT
jgi:hypothetical protein